jgi:hypothetical protein
MARPLKRIRKARLSPSARKDVTRKEYNFVIDVMNQRGEIVNDAIEELRRASEIQFKRIAQLQAEVDELKREKKGGQTLDEW